MQTCIKIELPYCPVYDCGYDAGKLHSDVINPLRCENVYTPVHNILISMQAQRCLIGQYARSELNLDLSIYFCSPKSWLTCRHNDVPSTRMLGTN